MNASRSVAGSDRAAPTVREELFPEASVLGYGRLDSRAAFYGMVQAVLPAVGTIVELGCGSGSWRHRVEEPVRRLCDLRGHARHVIGLDLDAACWGNPTVDRTDIIGEDGRLPLDDSSAHLVVAYAVLEHVADPEAFAAEIKRVLKPGGVFCAWTVNRWGYVGLGGRLVPARLHDRLLKRINPDDGRTSFDVFPTYHRMNTVGMIHRLFPGWTSGTHTKPGPAAYHGGSTLLARALLGWQRIAPPVAQTELVVLERKP